MRLPFQLLALVATILTPVAQASSSIRNPISALSTVQNATTHTRTHRITALSSFDLTFNLQNEVYVKFSLEPNHDVLPDEALTVTHLAPDGSVSRIEEVDRLGHKVYKGTTWIQRPAIGQSQWQNVGWARVMVDRDGLDPHFEGAFAIEHDHHHIQSAQNYLRTRHPLDPEADEGEDMVVWRDSDILPTAAQSKHQELRREVEMLDDEAPPSCQADGLSFNIQPDHPVYLGMAKRDTKSFGSIDFSNLLGLGKRQIDSTTGGSSSGVNLASTIGDTSGCPSTRKVALVGVATDCTYTGSFNSTESVRSNVISQMNTASALYESTFNISLGLQNLTVSDATCPGSPAQATEWNQDCSDGVTISDRLNYFSGWRGTLQDDNSHWTLLSTCNTGSAVGLAWLGQACVGTSYTTNVSTTGNGATSGTGQETVSGANVVVRTSGASEWQIIAHETGHTFGAVHDCTATTCADTSAVDGQQCCPLSSSTCDAGERFIMNPSTSQGITNFSPCSIGNICSAMGYNSVNSTCLTANKGVTTISGQQCGNGIVEAGEECDCGGTEGCGDNDCCDASTCKFKNGATCDDSNEDCCNSCQFATNGTVCRSSTGQCDPQEVCTGTSAVCPQDQTAPDGESCGKNLECTSGQCTSRDQQCKTQMGSYTQNNDTYACDNSGCTISCASPEFGPNYCYGLQQNFLDGTSCGGGGRCLHGQCKGSTFNGQVKSWIDEHKAIVIGIACAVGGLLFLAFLGCCAGCCRRRRHHARKPVPVRAAPVPPAGGWQGWNQPPPPPMRQRNAPPPYYNPSHASQGWFDQSSHRGGSGGGGGGGGGGWGASVPPPPPAYGGRSHSVRYA